MRPHLDASGAAAPSPVITYRLLGVSSLLRHGFDGLEPSRLAEADPADLADLCVIDAMGSLAAQLGPSTLLATARRHAPVVVVLCTADLDDAPAADVVVHTTSPIAELVDTLCDAALPRPHGAR